MTNSKLQTPNSQTVRTRFAPSPTGFQHVGNIRTALFAFLVAKHADGEFVLRLEDTDKNREVSGAADHLVLTLQTLHILWDEGYEKGGTYAPYIQSQRLDIYQKWAQKLIDAGRAYADPYSPEEVQAFRESAIAAKKPFLYREHRPSNPPAWDGTMPLRFKSDPKPYTWHDEVMGNLSTGAEVVDDFILIKSDGFPTYNFCHIVDDAEMKITHIIRGKEFVSSMPNYLNLYEALNLDRPLFAHMPHIMNEQGNKKLGKRDGAKDILDYIREGFLPETMMSFIATLGWNDGTEQEVFTQDELIEKFSLARVQRSGARFDEKRLLWMNGHFIRELSVDELYKRVSSLRLGASETTFWPESAKDASSDYKKQVIALIQDRLKTLADIPMMSDYFFREPDENRSLITDNKQLSKLTPDEIQHIIQAAYDALMSLDEWTSDSIQTALNQLLIELDSKPGIVFGLIRIVTTWAQFSPQLNDTLALLGRDITLTRMQTMLHE